MIEVTAKLIRGHVFLQGEVVECLISFSHPVSPTHKVSQSHADVFESLAWASAQIQCQCFTDSKISKYKEGLKIKQIVSGDTALSTVGGDNSRVEQFTKPKILFCDLRLSPGQSKTFVYREKILTDSPPSYRGQLVKYSYKIIIGTQRVNNPVKLLRVPIRVLPLAEAILNEAGALCNETTEELTPTNPFLEIRQKEKPIDLALQSLQNITARRNPNFYMISNIWGKVARFCLFKPAYKLGEDIIGTFDFTIATVSCMQVSVSLQCEEETTLDPTNEKSKQVRVITFSKQHEVCLGYKYTQLILPIPLHVTPAFTTDLVSLKWRLHFEFVTSVQKGLHPTSLEENYWQAPSEVPIETMVWSLPIRLYSTLPIHVAQGVQGNTIQKILIK
ncbi:RAB6A-GEF complex partner protein 2 [Sitophilus oryzae]|uniref:RAB6A-GEF complex partner protein 2 n=1 Tax=Sitophilus oryzae TaxID=7048 RepID=A0A6J2YFE7_SITOR|nr:RAB6A-GEF complex partner protein 2 [Sitophilus oryzae]XP_030762147.1 RAB6A-GEF complex partner protein 2 [Sitophilus oryzae]